MEDLTAMSARNAAAAIRAKKLSSLELVDACLRRVQVREPQVGAWAWLDAEAARAQARACDARAPRGVLHGVPIGVKDVIDTVDMPTEYGSPIYRGHRPSRDAACVSLIKQAGAVVFGKTVTTEFAMYQPNKTANPHNFAHTPGGSSSGSAAAVADYHVPLAFGTQTSGSIIRPAAFCGAVGYKPSLGTFAVEGAKTLAASLDTLGFIARSVDDLLLMSEALHATALPTRTTAFAKEQNAQPRIGYWIPPFGAPEPASDGMARAMPRLDASGFALCEVNLPGWFTDLNEIHGDVMNYEVARNHAYEYHEDRRTMMAAATRNIIEMGLRVSLDTYLARRAQMREARAAFAQAAREFDALIVPAALGEAPLGLSATGDPIFNRMWTLLGVPAITLPTGMGPNGLPIGVQLIGGMDRDLDLLAIGHLIEPIVAG